MCSQSGLKAIQNTIAKKVMRKYEPEGYLCSITVEVTEEQARRLDLIAKRNEFDAYFWAEKIQWLNNGDQTNDNCKVFRVNGAHMVAEEKYLTTKGCGGEKHVIHFTSGPHIGQTVESTNVWHQGEIPVELRDVLIDNATYSC